MEHINVEIKARCYDTKKIREILNEHNADFKGVDHQIDTYFRTNNGRLKLRQGNIENYLIYYEREDKEGPKQSDVVLMPTVLHSDSLKDILTKSLGVLVSVDKKREIYFIGNVKFHIDNVTNLGSFVEIEAINFQGNFYKDVLLDQCNHYMRLFGINEDDLISVSYSDLLIKMQTKQDEMR